MELGRFPMFSGLSPEDSELLAQHCIPVSYLAGQRIFDEGEPGRGFYLVMAGQVKVFKMSPKGQEQILCVAGPGQSFAEAAVLVGRSYPASAECLMDSALIFVEREPVGCLLARDPEFCMRLMAGMAMKLRNLVGLVEDLTLRDARGRISRYLVNLAPEEARGRFCVKLPTQQVVLARLLGLTQETLSRSLRSLKDEGFIESHSPGRSLWLNLEALREVVGST